MSPPVSGRPSTTATAPPSSPPSTGESVQYDVGGFTLAIHCFGTGSPTVVIVPGLGDDGSDWDKVAQDASTSSRICSYSRAGLGRSDPRPTGKAPTAGTMATELHALLAAAHVDPPYVLVVHSFGGLVGRMFIHQDPTAVQGAVFVDASTLDELRTPFFDFIDWTEADVAVDMTGTAKELMAIDALGSTPIVVLTQDATDDLRAAWFPIQDRLANASTDSLHVVVTGAGHIIYADNPAIVVAAIHQVVETVAKRGRLGLCAQVYPTLGGRCRAG